MQSGGIPLARIGIVGAILVIAFLAAGVACTITNHPDQANLLLGAAGGALAGTASTTVVVQQAAKTSNGNGTTTAGPKT